MKAAVSNVRNAVRSVKEWGSGMKRLRRSAKATTSHGGGAFAPVNLIYVSKKNA